MYIQWLILLNTWYLSCISYIPSKLLYETFVIDLWNMLTTDIAPYECCPSIIHNCHSIIAWCVRVMLSFYDTCSTCHRSMHYAAMQYCIVWSMGTTGITLYQHFVTARPSSVIGIKHNKCLFWDDIIHVIMWLLQSYDVVYLWFMLSMLSIYDHWYDAIPSIMHICHSITIWCVLVMLSFYGTCSTCHRSMHYAAMRYCFVRRPSWGPSLGDTSRWI
jgi:hypothetical protein